MTTFAAPLNTKIAAETSVLPMAVGGWYTVTIADGKNGLVLTTDTSNTINSLVIPAGRMITSCGMVCYEAFAGPASTRIDVKVGTHTLKANFSAATTAATATPDSGGSMVMWRPFTADTTVSYFVSSSTGTVPTAGKCILALQIA